MPKDWGAAVKYLGLWTGIGLAGWGLAGGRTAPQMEQAYPEDRAARLSREKRLYDERRLMVEMLRGQHVNRAGTDVKRLKQETEAKRLRLADEYYNAQYRRLVVEQEEVERRQKAGETM